MIDYDVLDSVGTTQERLREVFTAMPLPIDKEFTDEEKKKNKADCEIRQRFEKLIGMRLMEQINFGLRNHAMFSAVDLAWDSVPINKATYPLMLYAQGKLDMGACAQSLIDCCGTAANSYITRDEKGKATAVVAPKFSDVNVNLIRSFLTRRLAAQANKYNNLYPFYKYEARGTGLVPKLRADIMSQISDIVADGFDYRHHEVQVYRDTLMYAHSIDFVRCAWEKETQWVREFVDKSMETKEDSGAPVIHKKSVTVKEGLSWINPHPTRTFWDNAHPISSINTDTGCEYIGFWDVARYRDVSLNTQFWNRDTIRFTSNIVTLFSTYAQYFSQYYCVINPPCLTTDLSGNNDRRNNIGLYAGDMNDTSMILANYYMKIVPQAWGLGDYPYPIWLRTVCAGEQTVVFAEWMPSTPAAYCGYNENDSRQVNISVAHELMIYQDQMSNLQSYLMQCIRADNIKIVIIDVDSAQPDNIKAFRQQLKGRDYNSETTVLEVSRSKMQEMGINPEKIIQLVETRSTAIDIIFRAMIQLMNMVERLMALSPQEQGQPAPREISATETNLIAGTTESVYAFISDAFDEYRAAKKRILYESYLAKGDQKFRVPVINRYSEEVIAKAGFEIVDEESEEIVDANSEARRHTVIGSKEQLRHDYIFTSRDGAERPSNSQAANVLVQLSAMLQNPVLAEAIGKEKLYEIFNEIFRLSGAGVDLKLEVQEGESNQLGLDRFAQVQEVVKGLTDLVQQNQNDIKTMQRQLQMALTRQPTAAAA